MPTICPLCETESPDGSWECGLCGRQLNAPGGGGPPVERLAGLELTVLDQPLAPGETIPLDPEIELTRLDGVDLAVEVEPLEIERAGLGPEAPAREFWTAGLAELETGREGDGLPPTVLSEENPVCVWCGVPAPRAVCDNCGRRRHRGRGTDRAGAQVAGEGLEPLTMLCPACFTRVPRDGRCAECLAPLPPTDLY